MSISTPSLAVIAATVSAGIVAAIHSSALSFGMFCFAFGFVLIVVSVVGIGAMAVADIRETRRARRDAYRAVRQ